MDDLMEYLKKICIKNGIRVIFETRLSPFTPSSASLENVASLLILNGTTKKKYRYSLRMK